MLVIRFLGSDKLAYFSLCLCTTKMFPLIQGEIHERIKLDVSFFKKRFAISKFYLHHPWIPLNNNAKL